MNGCNDMEMAVTFGNVAMLHTGSLRGVNPWHQLNHDVHENRHLGKSNVTETNTTKKETTNNDNDDIDGGGGGDDGDLTWKEKQLKMIREAKEKYDAYLIERDRATTPTPLSASLLFALFGSSLLLDIYMNAFEEAKKKYTNDNKNIEMNMENNGSEMGMEGSGGGGVNYYETCLEIISMQEHIENTIPIALGYLLYSKIKMIRLNKMAMFLKRMHKQMKMLKILKKKQKKKRNIEDYEKKDEIVIHDIEDGRDAVKKYGLKKLEIDIDYEEIWLKYLYEQDVLLNLSIVSSRKKKKKKKKKMEDGEDGGVSAMAVLKKEMKMNLNGILLRYEKMKDVASIRKMERAV